MTEQEFDEWYDTADHPSIRDLCWRGTTVDRYLDEISDLKKALKYAQALYHGKMSKMLLEDGVCPICGQKNVPNREEAVPR